MMKAIFIFLAFIATPSFAYAQSIDMFYFGRESSRVAKIAIQLDYIEAKCFKRSGQPYKNILNSMLNEIGGRSVDRIFANASKVTKLSVGEIEARAFSEVDEIVKAAGGCSSKNVKAVIDAGVSDFGQGMWYLANVADLVKRYGERIVFY